MEKFVIFGIMYTKIHKLILYRLRGLSMKVCIISLCNLRYVPYYSIYANLFPGHDLLVWNRECIKEEPLGVNKIISYDGIDYQSKAITYFKFFLFARNTLKKQKYDLLVFLHSQLAVVLAGFLNKCYKGRYIIDIRDYTFEHIFLYKLLEKKLLRNSAINIISSGAYKRFLPKGEYFVLHNDRPIPLKHIKRHEEIMFDDKIVIGNIGTFRFFNSNVILIRAIKNDKRFQYNVYGGGAEILEDYVQGHSIDNVDIKGAFNPIETFSLYESCNLIFNLYGNNTNLLDYALSNKLYIAARFGIPILVCPGTYMAEIANKYNFAIVIDLKESNIKEKIFKKYTEMSMFELKQDCDEFIKYVEEENSATMRELKRRIEKITPRGK